MRRILLFTVALCVLFSVPGANAATKLTNKNSVSFPFIESGYVSASGVGCGSSASITFTVKAGALNLKVTSPKVGETTTSGGSVRIASVTVAANVATIVLIADGADICSSVDPDYPPASRPWSASLKVVTEYDRRVQVPVRTDLTGAGSKYKLKPKTMWNSKRSSPPDDKYYGLKWRRFGSKKAVGKGRLLQPYCHSGVSCPDNRKRVKITLTNPGFCQASGVIEYRHIRIAARGRLYLEYGDGKKNGGSLCNV